MIAHNQLLLTHLLITLKYQSPSMIAHTPNYCSHSSIVHDQLLRTRKYCADVITAQLFYCSRLTFVRTQLLLTTRNHYYSYSNLFPVQMLLILKYYLHAICAHNQFAHAPQVLILNYYCSRSTIAHSQQALIASQLLLLTIMYYSHSNIPPSQLLLTRNYYSRSIISHTHYYSHSNISHSQ